MVDQLVLDVAMDDIEVVHEKNNKVSYAEKFVADAKKKNKEKVSITLPDLRTVRYAHQVASCYLEGEIGQEIKKSESAYLNPDGTSRSKVGKIGGCLVHIEGKVRALKLQRMGEDTRLNWADTIIHKLNRLSIAID